MHVTIISIRRCAGQRKTDSNWQNHPKVKLFFRGCFLDCRWVSCVILPPPHHIMDRQISDCCSWQPPGAHFWSLKFPRLRRLLSFPSTPFKPHFGPLLVLNFDPFGLFFGPSWSSTLILLTLNFSILTFKMFSFKTNLNFKLNVRSGSA